MSEREDEYLGDNVVRDSADDSYEQYPQLVSEFNIDHNDAPQITQPPIPNINPKFFWKDPYFSASWWKDQTISYSDIIRVESRTGHLVPIAWAHARKNNQAYKSQAPQKRIIIGNHEIGIGEFQCNLWGNLIQATSTKFRGEDSVPLVMLAARCGFRRYNSSKTRHAGFVQKIETVREKWKRIAERSPDLSIMPELLQFDSVERVSLYTHSVNGKSTSTYKMPSLKLNTDLLNEWARAQQPIKYKREFIPLDDSDLDRPDEFTNIGDLGGLRI